MNSASGTSKILFWSLCLLIRLSISSGAQDAAILFPERYIELSVSTDLGSWENIKPSYSLFTGDFPYTLRFSPSQLAFYSGFPLFYPVIFSLGSASQLAYFDDYSQRSLISYLGGGYQSDLGFLVVSSGLFAGWGWRFDNFSGGFFYNYPNQMVESHLAFTLSPLSIRVSAQSGLSAPSSGFFTYQGLEASLRLQVSDPWGMSINLKSDDIGQVSFTLGMGTFLIRQSADHLMGLPWGTVAAHRGSMTQAPENSLPAVLLALENEVYQSIELDVQKTRDGQYVFVHDDTLKKYTGSNVKVRDLTWEELQKFDFGAWFHPRFKGTRILTLMDLSFLSKERPEIQWILDIKNIGSGSEDTAKFLQAVDDILGPQAPVVLATFDRELLTALKRESVYPVGFQVEVAQKLFLMGKLFPPVLKWELESIINQTGADGLFFTSPLAGRLEMLKALSGSKPLSIYFWNFHDPIYGLSP